jgi:hypothetical protein
MAVARRLTTGRGHPHGDRPRIRPHVVIGPVEQVRRRIGRSNRSAETTVGRRDEPRASRRGLTVTICRIARVLRFVERGLEERVPVDQCGGVRQFVAKPFCRLGLGGFRNVAAKRGGDGRAIDSTGEQDA